MMFLHYNFSISPSSSYLDISMLMPLIMNPAALEYKPLQPAQLCYYVPEPIVNPHSSFIPCFPCNTQNFIPCDDDSRKKKGKWVFVPPRLRKPRNVPMDRNFVRLKKQDSNKAKSAAAATFHQDNVSTEELKKLNGKTSIMIRNIPNRYKRINLQWLLDDHCRAENEKAKPGSTISAYDFLYLPMDFGFDMNLGYAFVNFTTPVAAARFFKAFNNHEWSFLSSRKKICQIRIAKLQGRYLKENFENSVFECHTDEYLPVVFSPPRDGFNHSRPSLIGRRTRVSSTPKDGKKVMLMTKRKNNKYYIS